MVFHGTFTKGVVVLEGPVKLKEGDRVVVEAMPKLRPEPDGTAQSRELLKLAGLVKDGPRDGSVNHDHYIYGTPKRETSE